MAVAACDYVCKSPIRACVEKDLTRLSNQNAAWIDGERKLHPTYAASENLTNSPHYDNGAGRCFAIFYPRKDKPNGITCLVFPMLNLIIRCRSTTIVSWVGNDMMHCSVSCNGGLRSLFMASNHRPVRHHLIELAFLKRGRNMGVIVGTEIIVRSRDVDVRRRRRGRKPPFKYTKARILSLEETSDISCRVVVQYLSNKKISVVDRNHICRVDCIRSGQSWR